MIVAGVGCKSGVSDRKRRPKAIEAALWPPWGWSQPPWQQSPPCRKRREEAAIADAAHRLDVTLVVADRCPRLPRRPRAA